MTTVTASEYDEQKTLFEYAALRANQDPDWGLLFCIPNGQYRPGQRPEAGLRAGVPDVFLPVPRGRHHGAFIEMKVGNNTLTPEQSWWQIHLRRQGYYTVACWGFTEAKEEIETYLSMGNRALEASDD